MTTRREFLTTTALAGAATLAAPYIKTAHSAGELSLGLWDHWVPGANDVLRRLIEDWGRANNVAITVDFITSQADKDMVTAAAEARARTGHDILTHRTWQVTVHRDLLEPVDDVVEELTSSYGPYTEVAAYLGKPDGVWRAVAAVAGSSTYPMVSRLDLWQQHAGIDLRELFPAGQRDPSKTDEVWTYATFLEAAKELHAAGHPFGNPIGPTSDSQDWLGPLFLSFGAKMVDQDGNIAVNSDATRAALEYMQQLTQYMPPDVYAWDDAGNNRWLISGQGSAIQNPPSAWAVAVRDQPQVGEQLWHHDVPRGPEGRFRADKPFFWGIWSFAQNKPAAKDLLLHLASKDQVAQQLRASHGFDMPQQPSLWDHPVWQEAGPPPGTLYNYPVRGDEAYTIAGYPARSAVAAQIYNEGLIPNMVARVTQAGESVDDALAWAEDELAGFLQR